MYVKIRGFCTRIISFELDTNKWKVGTYKCELSLIQGFLALISGSFELIIAKPYRTNGIPVYLWGGPGDKEGLHFYAHMGFDHMFTGADDAEKVEKWQLFDEALKISVNLGIRNSTFNVVDPKDAKKALNGYMSVSNTFNMIDEEVSRLQVKTNNGELLNSLCQLEPEVRERTTRGTGKIMGSIGTHPAFTCIFPNSEREDRLKLCHSDRCISIHKAHTNIDPLEVQEPKWIASGIIADDDMKYIATRYYWEYGDSWPVGNQTVAHTAHFHRSEIVVWSDPLRNGAVYHRFRGMGAISTWTYTNPDPKRMLFIETLIAAAKPENQGVIHTVTLWNYGGSLVPTEDRRDNVIAMGPDRLVETSWINLSRRPNGLCVYISSRLDPLRNKDPFVSPPETYEAFKGFVEEIVRPYGPMISKLNCRPRKVAVLDSIASRVHPIESSVWSYPNMRIYNLYTVLQMAHIPADVIFDETVERYGLDDYDILVLPVCPTLTESVYRRIRQFMADGGIVVADQYLRADLPGALRVDFDFDYRSRVTANMIAANKDFEIQDDLIGRKDWGLAEGRGVTAMEDQMIMESYAQKLRELLEEKVEREVDASVPTVIMNLLEYDDIPYLFVVNDKRTYGDRVGKWKAMLEKGVAQRVTINWKIPQGQVPVVYDLIRGERLEIDQISSEEISFQVNLPPAGGSIVAKYPRPLKEISIKAPSKLHKGTFDRISISVLDEKGLNAPGVQPIQIDLLDAEGKPTEWSGYYVAERGQVDLDILPAENELSGTWKLTVTELGTRLNAKKKMILL